MEDLTFGEQVKIILGRKGMTIKQLAEQIEEKTGKKMSRQNLTQRLGRDNFQEQDMRMIASILECPFYLSIMGEVQHKSIVKAERPTAEHEVPEQAAAAAMPEIAAAAVVNEQVQSGMDTAVSESIEDMSAENEYDNAAEEAEAQEEAAMSGETEANVQAEGSDVSGAEEQSAASEELESAYEAAVSQPSEQVQSDEVDMTIGELYDIHEELSELEENARAGEPVEAIKEELEKPKKERFSFFRRKRSEPVREKEETKQKQIFGQSADKPEIKEETSDSQVQMSEAGHVSSRREEEDFEPVISREDSDEDVTVGDVNPYTGREYQSNSVRMHPTRIGYVQVYDRNIHKWTDMTEWAFLGYQERKKALLGKAYEPPIYLD